MDKSKDSTTEEVVPDNDPGIENSDEEKVEGDDVDKQLKLEPPTSKLDLPKDNTAKDNHKDDEDTHGDNSNPSSGGGSDEKGPSQSANGDSGESGENEGMQIKDDVDKQLESEPPANEQNLPKDKTAKGVDNNNPSGESSDDKNSSQPADGGSGDSGGNEVMQIDEKNDSTTESSQEQEEQPHNQLHTDDQEMASQSSGGDTEPADVSSENDEDKNKQTTGSTNGIPGTRSVEEEVKEKNSGKYKKKNDKGSDDDERRSTSWHQPITDCAKSWWDRPRTLSLPKLSRYSSRDTVQYRREYPDKEDDPRINCNYEFYTNLIPSYPEGNFVDIIHEEWWGNYRLLEYHHSYIQWLFPIRERGLNWHAQELQLHEKKKIIEDKKAHRRVLKSYEMMLDFYGLELVNEKTGEVKRSNNWEDRFDNLNYSGHNYLRITRILKCLGEFEYEHLKTPLIRHFLHEAITERTLPNILSSCVQYWIEVVKDDKEREELITYAQQLIDEYNRKITREK